MKPAAADPTLRLNISASSRLSGGVRSSPSRRIPSRSIAMKIARLGTMIEFDEGSDRRQRTAQGRDREIGHALEDLAQCCMERSGDVDRDPLPVEPRLDVVQERRRARREIGQRGRELRERVDQRGDDPHDHQCADEDDRDDHGYHRDPLGSRVKRRWRKSATGEMRNASSQAKKKMRISRK